MKQTILTLFSALLISTSLLAQIPANYYNSAAGLNGDALRLALFNIIKNHNSQSYGNLWNNFATTDKQPGTNLIWDIYSDNPNGTNPYNYTYGSDQCGNYNAENVCYNREHSMPKSWFHEISPMKTDLFHIYPTDGYVNNRRSNNSYGEVGSASWTSQNGSKLGTCNYPGYSTAFSNSKVFEPIDAYKGDLARSYFYMLTRYRFRQFYQDGNNHNDMVVGNGGTNVTQFTPWAENMLVEWATNDPVSQKEIDRNNAIYQIQGNRNPYIDHPEWITMVWGPLASIDNYKNLLTKAWYANNQLHINGEIKQISNVVIYNMLGEKVSSNQISNNKSTFDIQLPKGVYLVTIEGKLSNTLKFVVG